MIGRTYVLNEGVSEHVVLVVMMKHRDVQFSIPLFG